MLDGGACGVPRHRADRRCQLGVHARRSRRAAADRQFDLHYIEQPLHWDDLVDHATLAPQLQTPLCLDETLTSPARVKAALDLKACSVVNVKVGRVGGLAATKVIHDHCASSVACRCGAAGMLETGIGRAHNIHVATHARLRVPRRHRLGEPHAMRATSPSRRWRQPTGSCRCRRAPGIGVTLDRAFLETVTESVEIVRR